MATRTRYKKCGCRVLIFTGKDSGMGTLNQLCELCRPPQVERGNSDTDRVDRPFLRSVGGAS